MIKLTDLMYENAIRDDFAKKLTQMLQGKSHKLINALLMDLTAQPGPNPPDREISNRQILCTGESCRVKNPDYRAFRTNLLNNISNPEVTHTADTAFGRGQFPLPKLEIFLRISSAYYQATQDKNFIKQLYQQMGVNQNQIMRSLSPVLYRWDNAPLKEKTIEHIIPNVVFRDALVDMVINGDFSTLNQNVQQLAQMSGVPKEVDKELITASMPNGWNWGDNKWARYVELDQRRPDLNIRDHIFDLNGNLVDIGN